MVAEQGWSLRRRRRILQAVRRVGIGVSVSGLAQRLFKVAPLKFGGLGKCVDIVVRVPEVVAVVVLGKVGEAFGHRRGVVGQTGIVRNTRLAGIAVARRRCEEASARCCCCRRRGNAV